MRKSVIRALEKVFEAEIYGRLPFCSKAKIYKVLCDEGYLQPMERQFAGKLPVTVIGYQLTHFGRYAYCRIYDEPPNNPIER